MNKKVYIWISVAIIALIIIATNINSSDKVSVNKPIEISIVMPLSGELAMFGDNISRGVDIALAQSGLSTSTIHITREDTSGFTTNGALSAFRRAIEIDHADVVFGPFGPAQTLTIAPTLSSTTDTTVISISNCDERFKNYPTIFCIYPGINDQVSHAVDFIKLKGWKKVYLLTENTEFGLLIENVLKNRSDDITLIGSEKIVPNQTKDFRTIITKVVVEKPDVVYAAFAPNEGLILLRQYTNLSKNIPLYIGTDINKDQLKDIFGQEAKGVYFSARLSENYNNEFVDEFNKLYNSDPDYFAALSHSSASLLFSVLKENNNDLSKVREKLINKTVETSAVDGFKFKSDRTVYVPLHSYEFKGGEFVEVIQ